MANRMIYISDVLNNKLKEESNASALIVRLIKDYYDSIGDPREKLEEVNKEIETKAKEVEELKVKVEELEKRREESLINEVDMERDIEKQERGEARALQVQREAFDNYIIPAEIKEQKFEEFISLLKKGSNINIVGFMDSNNFKRKEVRQWNMN